MLKILFLALSAAAPALATTQDDVLQADLLPGWQMQNGHHMAGLRLQLAPDWKTYWRSPGDAGIPPLFNWSGSVNVKSVRVHWPSPVVFHTNGMQTIGYQEGVVLPLEVVPLDASKPVELRAGVDLGVCNKICMPAAVQLTAVLDAGGADPAIKAALKAQPLGGKAAGLRAISCELTPIADGLRLTAVLDLPQRGAETVVFETSDASVWVGEAESARTGGRLTAVADLVASNGAPFALDRSGVTVTVLGAGGSVEIAGCPAP
ncbi:MAG: protein-disulfide reductase DsbD family protein [Cypionkella sp.]|uniref:protein-disulfide reductase DsbD domain-containing protein n=1 Tax=Cypionkella sp. TaxID=2811411 RepID=UPI002ABBB736|nr:protein-disulfide reductase DsbD domain-containing protein [Cypionkella sp.]MDZ4310774.1 protein-disulfide reductase DsbD family protein [Cypionkella sp.]MDZ4395644.1 protein-disulfide reductase DsbD family protein [Cypionkella sp.]